MKLEMPDFPAPILLMDDFMSRADAAACLQECIDMRPVYMPATVGFGVQNRRDLKIRRNDVVMMDSVFGADRSRSKILTLLDARVRSDEMRAVWHKGYYIFDEVNYANWRETVVSCYGKCDFYGRHQDTIMNGDDLNVRRRRMVTLVLYLNIEPESFTGGELTIYQDDRELTIKPKHNLAVAFPSFCWHNVRNVDLPKDSPWSGSRFSVNHWLGFQ